MTPQVDLRDVPARDHARVVEVAARVRIDVVGSSADPAFTAAYDALDGFFGARGEMEDRPTLARLVDAPRLDYRPGLVGHYRLLAAWHGDDLAAARDCWIDLDEETGVCQVALSHVWVAPPWRRTGLAALLRALPATLARPLAAAALGPDAPVVLAAEMEPVDPAEPDTVVRLLAYGRSGFAVLDPTRVPYAQPDLRLLRPVDGWAGLPLLPVVRVVGAAGPRAVPAAHAAAFPRLFHAGHRLSLPAERVDPCELHALGTLARDPADVALLPLPGGPGELGHLAPLVRGAILPLYPPALRGPDPTPGDPADQLRRVLEVWGPDAPARTARPASA